MGDRPKHIIAWLVIATMFSGSLVGCVPGEGGENLPVEIEDQLGRVVRLEKVPERVISLAPSNTEILFALGLGERVVGVTEYCNFPVEAREKEKVGGFSTPDIEKIVSLNPDLIVATSIHLNTVIPELERLNLPTIVLDPKTLGDILESVGLVGVASGHAAEANELVNDMQKRIDQVTGLTRGLSAQDRLDVFYIVWHDPLQTVGSDKLINELIELAGGRNIFGDLTGYPKVDLEVVLERDPQVILAGSGHGSAGDSPFWWATNESRLKGTTARKQGYIYEIDADLVSRPGPRIVQGLEDMLRFIHPELYQRL